MASWVKRQEIIYLYQRLLGVTAIVNHFGIKCSFVELIRTSKCGIKVHAHSVMGVGLYSRSIYYSSHHCSKISEAAESLASQSILWLTIHQSIMCHSGDVTLVHFGQVPQTEWSKILDRCALCLQCSTFNSFSSLCFSWGFFPIVVVFPPSKQWDFWVTVWRWS